MVSMTCENRCAWLRVNRPQVLNALASTSSTPSEPPLNGDAVIHEKEASLSHRDERQIMLDTDRSFVHYPSGEAPSPIPLRSNIQRMKQNAQPKSFLFVGESDAVKEEMKTKLNELIVSVFRRRPTLNYYQVRIPLTQRGNLF